MRKLMGAAGRRTAGMAAGLILTGGLAGGVLLTPGTAYAAGLTPAITGTTQTPGFGGTTLNVQVSVTPAPTLPGGAVSVSDGAGGGCSAVLGAFGPGAGTGNCSIADLAAGTYTLTATYEGSPSSPVTVTIGGTSTPAPEPPTSGNAPVFSADSPPSSVDGPAYSYTFQASGSPSYELVGAPDWLSIDPNTGIVSGTIPDGFSSFSYSVKAWNSFGFVLAGPFNVFFRHGEVNLHTHLYCTSPVFTGQHGSCTLSVTNWGSNYYWGPSFNADPNFNQDPNFAPDVTAQISLPWQLRADFCGSFRWFSFGCTIFGNTASENLGPLRPGQTKYLTVVFTAETGFGIWGRHHGRLFTVAVFGSASSYGNSGFWFFGQQQSFSVAYVTIIPRGFWW